jgi:hypothetical protein
MLALGMFYMNTDYWKERINANELSKSIQHCKATRTVMSKQELDLLNNDITIHQAKEI